MHERPNGEKEGHNIAYIQQRYTIAAEIISKESMSCLKVKSLPKVNVLKKCGRFPSHLSQVVCLNLLSQTLQSVECPILSRRPFLTFILPAPHWFQSAVHSFICQTCVPLCPSRSLFLCSLQLYFAVRIFSTFSDFLSIHSRRSAAICRPLRQLTIFYSSCISIFCDSYIGPQCLYIHRSLFSISVSVEEAV